MQIRNLTRDILIAQHVRVANSFRSRLIGLMGHRTFGMYDGLLLFPCNSIHTCFMHFSIDVIFLDRDKLVLDVRIDLPPWRVTHVVPRSYYVLELPAHTLSSIHVEAGDHLEWGK